MKYLAFTIIFLTSCQESNTNKTHKISDSKEYYDRYEVIESGNKYILYKSYSSGHTVVIDATKDSLTTELLKQTLKRNE